MSFESEVRFEKEHPSFAGHFPGNPVVAGVLILDQVRALVAQYFPSKRIASLPQVKFAAPLLPEQNLKITLEEENGKCRFSCHSEERLIAQGELRLTDAA